MIQIALATSLVIFLLFFYVAVNIEDAVAQIKLRERNVGEQMSESEFRGRAFVYRVDVRYDTPSEGARIVVMRNGSEAVMLRRRLLLERNKPLVSVGEVLYHASDVTTENDPNANVALRLVPVSSERTVFPWGGSTASPKINAGTQLVIHYAGSEPSGPVCLLPRIGNVSKA